MNYNIVKDEKLLKDFIEWLPELKPEEKYYLCLFARNKYCRELTHIKSDKAQLKRFVSDKERMFYKIKQLETEVGNYRQKEIPVPEEALALYITVNPRDMYKASINTMVKLAKAIRDQNVLMNVHQEALSEIQKCKSRTCYIDFDIDANGPELESQLGILRTLINDDCLTVLKTRGGAHVLVDPKKVDPQYKNSFYMDISQLSHVDQSGDGLIPVPGCTQGMFIPHFINLNYDKVQSGLTRTS